MGAVCGMAQKGFAYLARLEAVAEWTLCEAFRGFEVDCLANARARSSV